MAQADRKPETQFQFHSLAASKDLVSEANNKSSSFSLKLKVPTSESPLVTDHGLRTCSECGKQFSSGKALGGHKRACLQKKNSNNINQAKQKIKNVVAVAMKLDRDRAYQTTTSTQEEEEQQLQLHVCYVCHQGFRSLKSLYGHMRKHPEREWRGVQPPKRDNRCTSSTTLSNDNDDDGGHHQDDDSHDSMGSDMQLEEKIKSWSVKAKRGQRLLSDGRLSTSVSEDDESESEAMQQAVNDLLLLAQLSPNDCAASSTKKKKKMGFDQVPSVVNGSGYGLLKVKEKRVGQAQAEEDEEAKKKLQLMCDSENTWIMECEYEDDSEMETMKKLKQMKMKKKRRLNELDDCVDVVKGGLDQPIITMAQPSYSCSICNKAFDKHQALGGHVASHNKNKNNLLINSVKESSAASAASDRNSNASKAEEKVRHGQQEAAASEEETGESSRVAAAASAGAGTGSEQHRCNKCDKSFPTGQALGGHKRCHYSGPAEAFSSSSQVTTSAGEVTQRAPSSISSRPVHNFDLNEPPAEFYQDEYHAVEAASAAATAAS